MTLPPLAPVSALETRLGVDAGSLAGADLARAEADLGDASALVRSEARLAWVGADGAVTAPDVVVTVVVRAALRSYRNPDGYQGENLGGSYSYQFAQGETGVYLTADEIRVVRQAATAAGAGGAASVRVVSAYYDPAKEAIPPWWPIEDPWWRW